MRMSACLSVCVYVHVYMCMNVNAYSTGSPAYIPLGWVLAQPERECVDRVASEVCSAPGTYVCIYIYMIYIHIYTFMCICVIVI